MTLYLRLLSVEETMKLFDCTMSFISSYIICTGKRQFSYLISEGFCLVRAKKNGEIHNIKNPSIYTFEELKNRQITIL